MTTNNAEAVSLGIPQEFSAYFDLPPEVKATALSEGVVVFDTSTLLSLYRIEPKQRKIILAELVARLKGRVWLPHQVFLEFSRHMKDEKLKDSQRLAKTHHAIQQRIIELKNEITAQKLDELDPDFSMDNFNRKINSMQGSISKSIERVKSAYPDLSKSDEVLLSILKITEERIIPGFENQTDVDAAAKAGEERYSKEIPPGYLDQKKDGAYFHRGLQIPRKFGDWFLWHQLIEQVRREPKNFHSVVFVTQDQKNDWWTTNPDKSGETIGPRFELRQEIEEAGAKTYWQYTFQNFYKHLISIGNEITPDQSAQLQEISNAERRTQIDLATRGESSEDWEYVLNSAKSQNWNKAYSTYYGHLRDVKSASAAAFNSANIIKTWLRDAVEPRRVREAEGFPDFLVFDPLKDGERTQSIIGIEVLHPQGPEQIVQLVRRALTQNSAAMDKYDKRMRKLYFLIVLNEFVVEGSKHGEWNEALIDLQGFLIEDSRMGVSIGFLQGGKFEVWDKLFSIEEPHLMELLRDEAS